MAVQPHRRSRVYGPNIVLPAARSPLLPLTADQTLARAFSVQALSVAQLEAARRANYTLGSDADLHARLTAAQGVLLAAQAALYPLLKPHGA